GGTRLRVRRGKRLDEDGSDEFMVGNVGESGDGRHRARGYSRIWVPHERSQRGQSLSLERPKRFGDGGPHPPMRIDGIRLEYRKRLPGSDGGDRKSRCCPDRRRAARIVEERAQGRECPARRDTEATERVDRGKN